MKRVKTGLELEGPLNLRNNHLQKAILSATDLQFEDWAEQHQISDLKLLGNTLILEYERALPNGTFATETKTVNLTPFSADVQITGATLTNPSAGVWMLNITESNGDVHQVDLANLIAVNIQNFPGSNIDIEGNGTASNPLRVTFNGAEAHQINIDGNDLETVIYNLQNNITNLQNNLGTPPRAITFNVERASITNNPASELILKVPFAYFSNYNSNGEPQHQFVASVRQTLDNFMYSEEIVTPFTCMRNEQDAYWEFNFGMFNSLPGGVDFITVTIIQNTVSHGNVADAQVSFRPV